MSSDINDDPVGNTPMETTHLAGPPVRIEGTPWRPENWADLAALEDAATDARALRQSLIGTKQAASAAETIHLAGQSATITPGRLTIARITDLDSTTIQVVPHPQTLKDEITRLRAELIDAKQTASAAAADTAVARMALRMAVDQHDREAKELKRTIARLFSTIAAQTADMERLAAVAVAREYAAPAQDAEPSSTDAADDWLMPGGLPRGVRSK